MEAMSVEEFGAGVQRLIMKQDLSREETYRMFAEVLQNRQPDLQQGAFLAALVAKGETDEEIAGAWEAIDRLDTVHIDDLPEDLFENSGTGMDAIKTFNVSSAAAVIAASCGVTMARHGARAITSKCGTVDVLEATGIDVECPAETVAQSIRQAGIGIFNGMSAHVHPGALGRILSQIRFGSTLNIAASLANPARPSLGLRGVYNEEMVDRAARVMKQIGYKRGMVVFGRDAESGQGMDELSVCGPTCVHRFDESGMERFTVNPEDFGIKRHPVQAVKSLGCRNSESVRFLQVLSANGRHPACEDFASLNAAAILSTAGVCADINQGIAKAREAMASGAAMQKLREWASHQDAADGAGLGRLEALQQAAAV